MYLEGRKSKAGVTILSRSAARGARLLTRAAGAGKFTAVFRLAVCFDFGEGVKRNPSTAAALYRRAARGGIADAATNLAVSYRERGNWRLAERWFRKAARLGETDALMELDRMALERRWTRVKMKPLLTQLKKLASSEADPEASAILLRLQQVYPRGSRAVR